MSRKQRELDRIVFFSDAVFAIAITLLAIGIKLPYKGGSLTSTQLSHDLLNLFPQYQGYVVSFLIIGFYWISHHQYFRYINGYDYKLIWLNTGLLMCIAFLPFPTSVLDSYRKQPIAVVFYAGTMIATGLMNSIVWWYASSGRRLVHKNLPVRLIRSLSFRAVVPPLIFVFSIPVAFFSPTLAELSWTSIPIVFVLIKRFKILSMKRPVGLVAIVFYKSFVASLMMVTAIAALFAFKNHQILEQFSQSYFLESKLKFIDWILDKILNLNPKTLQFSGLAAALYAGITAVEAVGLWYEKLWARILVIVLFSVSIPFEVLELVRGVSILKLIVFLVNLAVLGYLIRHFYQSKN